MAIRDFELFFFFSLAVGASVDIDLEVFVNRSTAPDLNSGQQQLEDILVLHLERGKDYFISITGSYLPSCFGSSIHMLCQLREPIQEMPLETIHKLVSYTGHIIPSLSKWLKILNSKLLTTVPDS